MMQSTRAVKTTNLQRLVKRIEIQILVGHFRSYKLLGGASKEAKLISQNGRIR